LETIVPPVASRYPYVAGVELWNGAISAPTAGFYISPIRAGADVFTLYCAKLLQRPPNPELISKKQICEFFKMIILGSHGSLIPGYVKI